MDTIELSNILKVLTDNQNIIIEPPIIDTEYNGDSPQGIFDHDNRRITLYTKVILKTFDSRSNEYKGINKLDYCVLVYCHELGHLTNENLEITERIQSLKGAFNVSVKADFISVFSLLINLVIKSEHLAWKNGEKYLNLSHQSLSDQFNLMNGYNIVDKFNILFSKIKLALDGINNKEKFEEIINGIIDCLTDEAELYIKKFEKYIRLPVRHAI
ncbi:hypothetical protein EHS13_22970 [Paenibacillus psychroresistens]|uniref:Uncharacterized protein n=1 Tax=Paenibacillus psychroresistens TaxID=1778678 RepID=A0A6B8RPT4_9BACL|nr:hypothetical protein [Paenibacillus psychroresistens]QGQ97545.1 hypothetical protein EHS13_22970 [Paenibacillus psychroresistens]